jgi:CBS-domain-containing membrane protein
MVEANAPDKSKDTATADLDKLVSLVNEAIDSNIEDLQQGIHHIDFQA